MRGETPRSSLVVRLAKALMHRFESAPSDPTQRIGGLNEVFRHPLFAEGSEAERGRIMLASAQGIYDDEVRYPWDNYFGRDLAPSLKGKDALDLGCFTGGRAVAWTERYNLSSISGIDTDDIFIEAAQAFARRQEAPATFTVGRGEKLPFDDDTFDAILSFDVFEHVQDPGLVLAECRRVLKPGGRAFLVFPSFFHPIEHHLSLVTTAPCIHYLFKPRVLLSAYCAILEERGEGAMWYSRGTRELRSWERGHTINGLTLRRFRQLARETELTIVEQVRRPLGSVGRRSQGSRVHHLLGTLLRPLTRLPFTEEVVLHRAVFILGKPAETSSSGNSRHAR